MSDTLKKFKVSLYSTINKFIYRKRIVELICGHELRKHIEAEEFGSVQVHYEVADEFSDELLYDVEANEKGSTTSDVLAFTEVNNPDIIYVVFSLKAILNFLSDANPLWVWYIIKQIAKHEAYHAKQYNYIVQNGGMDAVGRFSEYMREVDYEDNVLEKGANDYQEFDKEQDFSIFDKFIWPERFVGASEM